MGKEIKVGLSVLLLAALALSFIAGWTLGAQPRAPEGLGVVEEAWNIILRDYVGKDDINTSQLSQGAIRGMLEALGDPHTSYLDSESFQLESSNLEGSIEGIGATMVIIDVQPVVVDTFADSPAAEAGIMPGDIVLEIDGQSTEGMSLAETILKIRGPVGTSVGLLVLHEGDSDPVLIEITRAKIEVPSVEFEALGDIAYIRISHFSQRTAQEISSVIAGIPLETTGIVLDLRSNNGGLLDAVVDVAGYFLDEGVVVYVVEGEERAALEASPDTETTHLPMVVLVDGYSASGAEVLAGALQDHKRATIAGTTTFGKGSAGVIQRLDDGSAIYIITARWLTPDGRLIEGEGLVPDIELDLGQVDAVQWAIDYLKGR